MITVHNREPVGGSDDGAFFNASVTRTAQEAKAVAARQEAEEPASPRSLNAIKAPPTGARQDKGVGAAVLQLTPQNLSNKELALQVSEWRRGQGSNGNRG